MWIEREITPYIQELVGTRPCILLTGARQTGKSSLLERLFPQYNYVSLDLPGQAAEANENGSYFLEKHGPNLIIDEIQYAPGLFRFLKTEIDKKRNVYGRYILTGSQKFSLMKGISESLSGRISIAECYSLSVRELMEKEKTKLSISSVLSWMLKGGYPELHANNLDPQRFYADYLATYLERDVRQLVNVKDLSSFDRFLRLLALRSGQILQMNSFAVDVGVSPNTIKSWISILETSNIIYLLKPFYQNFGKRLIKSPKVYFLDTGLLCFLAGIYTKEVLESSMLLGSFFETFALGQLIRSYVNHGKALNMYYFRDNHGLEVDFIIPEGNQLYAYDCKWSHQSGKLPENILKFIKTAGANSIKTVHIVTGGPEKYKISRNGFVTNIAEF
ncbi:MAG: ATP-binding protein [Spirochaetales bacterium]|nr:ATP-binding protein [Spirochaetales bacterium]